jgi:hypothetical protein
VVSECSCDVGLVGPTREQPACRLRVTVNDEIASTTQPGGSGCPPPTHAHAKVAGGFRIRSSPEELAEVATLTRQSTGTCGRRHIAPSRDTPPSSPEGSQRGGFRRFEYRNAPTPVPLKLRSGGRGRDRRDNALKAWIGANEAPRAGAAKGGAGRSVPRRRYPLASPCEVSRSGPGRPPSEKCDRARRPRPLTSCSAAPRGRVASGRVVALRQ